MMDRREFLERCGAAGLAQTLFPGAVLGLMAQNASAQAAGQYEAPRISENPAITPAMLDAAAAIAGITLTDEQKTMMLGDVITQLKSIQAIRDLHLPNAVAPADVFDPRPVGFVMPQVIAAQSHDATFRGDVSALLADKEKLAFASIAALGALLRSKKISAVELVKFYLERMHRLDPKLHMLITATEERALKQAAMLDAEAAKGKYRGPLHGIPWGAKDLLAVKGYPTTWGAGGFEHQVIDEDATVVQRLDAAGAVLIAKLTLGALAQGDLWFGGKTRNPWNPKQGSSGSSAGPASAVSAGCCAFAIGSETQGSISSPSTRCGVTGHRPTFGLVPRTGAMALSWSMDKLGPICHTTEDAALVMAAIAGADGKDRSVHADVRFVPTSSAGPLRVGYIESAFAEPVLRAAEKDETAVQQEQRKRNFERQRYDNKYDRAALDVLRDMGVNLVPVKLPDLPFSSISKVLSVEAAAAFDEITRNGRVNLLTEQSPNDWPNQFRTARMYSGVDYVQAMRARSLIITKMAKLFATVDVIVTPSGGAQLTATNLSGHPAVIVPNGLRGKDAPLPQDTSDGGRMNVGGPGTPVSITFMGQLYDDARVLAFARMYQEKTGFHLAHPTL